MFTGRGLLSSVGATSRSRPGSRSYQISAANETLSHENGIIKRVVLVFPNSVGAVS